MSRLDPYADPAVVYREMSMADFRGGLFLRTYSLPFDYDPSYYRRRDGEWPDVASLPYERVEFEGVEVPVYDLAAIDPERAAWEAARA